MLRNLLLFMFMVEANQTVYFASFELAQFSQKDTLPLMPPVEVWETRVLLEHKQLWILFPAISLLRLDFLQKWKEKLKIWNS